MSNESETSQPLTAEQKLILETKDYFLSVRLIRDKLREKLEEVRKLPYGVPVEIPENSTPEEIKDRLLKFLEGVCVTESMSSCFWDEAFFNEIMVLGAFDQAETLVTCLITLTENRDLEFQVVSLKLRGLVNEWRFALGVERNVVRLFKDRDYLKPSSLRVLVIKAPQRLIDIVDKQEVLVRNALQLLTPLADSGS